MVFVQLGDCYHQFYLQSSLYYSPIFCRDHSKPIGSMRGCFHIFVAPKMSSLKLGLVVPNFYQLGTLHSWMNKLSL